MAANPYAKYLEEDEEDEVNPYAKYLEEEATLATEIVAAPVEEVASPPISPPTDLDEAEEPGLFGNAFRMAGERMAELGGNLLGGFETLGDFATDKLNIGGFAATPGKALSDETAGYKYLPPAEWNKYRDQKDASMLFSDMREEWKAVDLGSVQSDYWGEMKRNPSLVAKAKNLGAFGVETGIVSLSDMAAVVVMFPAWWVSFSEQLAQERAANDGREGAPTEEDWAIAGTTTAVIGAMERFGFEAIASAFIKGGNAFMKLLKAAVGEGGTEFVQEQMEYGVEVLGTKTGAELSTEEYWLQSLERGAQGAVGGGTAGTALATPGIIAGSLQGRYDQENQPPELFRPSHNAGGGIPVQQVTKKGKVVPDTYITADGKVFRDSNAVAIEVEVGDTSTDVNFDVSATVEAIKDDIQNLSGPYGQEGLVEMGTGLPTIEPVRPPDKPDDDGPPPPSGAGGIIESRMDVPEEPIDLDLDLIDVPEEAIDLDLDLPFSDLNEEANRAATSAENDLPEPSQEQKEDGSYQKGHPVVQGMNISIENPAGSKRRPEWPTLKQHYGYIRGTVGADSEAGATGREIEQVDVFVKPEEGQKIADDNPVFIIDQTSEDGSFDEHKVMLGFATEAEARAAYLENYTKGWTGLGQISQATPEEFKSWLKDGDTKSPYGKPISKPAKPKLAEIEQKLEGEAKVTVSRETPKKGKSRVDLPHKDVVQRVPELQAAAKKLAAGEMTKEAYDKLVNEVKPIEPYKEVPIPAKPEDMLRALSKNKTPKLGKGSEIEDGHQVGLRLDIPAYRDHNVWVPTIHEGEPGKGKGPITYEATAVLTDATFPEDKQALTVAQGAPKRPSAVIKGRWLNQTQEETIAEARAALKDPAWEQVGFDPERHSYFYHRDSTLPIKSAEKIIQVGGLVMVKNPVFGKKKDYLFKRGKLDKTKKEKPSKPDSVLPYSEMVGREVTFPVRVESTGKEYTVTVDAAAVMRELDTQLEVLDDLKACAL